MAAPVKKRPSPSGFETNRHLGATLLAAAVQVMLIAVFALLLPLSHGTTTVLLLTMIVPLVVALIASACCAFQLLVGRETFASGLPGKVQLSIVTTLSILTLFEAFLQWQATTIAWDPNHPPENLLIPPLILPRAWEAQAVDVGIDTAMRWHTHLHYYDINQMRLRSKLPLKKDGVFRILIFGDSFTYGYGVPEEETYSKVLEQMLNDEFNVEVFNLGVYAYNSTDILSLMKQLFPADQQTLESAPDVSYLGPDLLIYGVCLNDYDTHSNEASEGESVADGGLVGDCKAWLVEKTYVARFFDERIDDVMIAMGLRDSFTSEIEDEFAEKRRRFANDVQEMGKVAHDFGLPPVLAMVLLHEPQVDSRQHELARKTERLLSEVGMTVVPTEGFVEKHNGRRMFVSRWERHPNAEAHRLFAEQFAMTLRTMPILSPHRRGDD